MFVRKKKNRSGTVSVVVTDKSGGKFRELKTVGVSSDADEIARLEVKARQWIDDYTGQQRLDFDESAKALQEARNTIARIERTLQNTPQVILGGRAAARHLPLYGQAVQHATGESPADKRGAHYAYSRRPDRDRLL